MAKKQIVLLFFAGIFFIPSSGWSQTEQWLQYRYSRQAHEMIEGMGGQSIKLSSNAPEGLKLPEKKGDEVFWGQWSSPMVPGGSVWMAILGDTKTGVYKQLIIDTNTDGRLEDESLVEAHHSEKYSSEYYTSEFGPVKMMFASEDGPITYHLNFNFTQYRENKRFFARAGCWYEGPVLIDGLKEYGVLIDGNAIGAFNDKSLDFGQCDRIRIGEMQYEDFVFTGRFLQRKDKYYSLDVAPDGAYVRFSPAEKLVFGTIRVQPQIQTFRAGGENGLFNVAMDKGVGQLPVGTYRIERWEIQKKDDKGKEWRLKGEWFDDKGIFEVKDGSATEIAAGEPVRCSFSAERQKDRHNFNQELKGRLGERIEITRNNQRPSEPRLHIREETGRYDRHFKLEYG